MSFLTPKGQLDNAQIRNQLFEYLYRDGYKPSEMLVDDILEQFWFRDYMNSLIAHPIFLDYLKLFLDSRKPEYFNRFDFFDFFFNYLFSSDQIQSLKRVGAAFELKQTDRLTAEMFEKLVTELEIDANSFIKLLKEKRVVVADEESQSLKWYHHTLTEYLAAQFILFDKVPVDLAKKLMVLKKEGIIAIKPSWYGVIRFLLESPQKIIFIDWLVSFGSKNEESIDEVFSETLTSVVYTNKLLPLSPETETTIFRLIYEAHQKNLFWISVWTRSALGKLLKPGLIDRLKHDTETVEDKSGSFVVQSNAISVVGFAFEKNPEIFSLEERDYWKDIFIQFANVDDQQGVLIRQSLHALEKLGDPEIIDSVSKALNHPQQLVREAFTQLVGETAADIPQGVKYLIEAIKNGDDIYGRHGLYKINSLESISFLLSQMVEDRKFLEIFLDRESIFNSREEKADKVLINTIRKFLNKSLIKTIKNVIVTGFTIEPYRSYNSSFFLDSLTDLIQEVDGGFLIDIIEFIKKVKDPKERTDLIFDYRYLFVKIIKAKDLNYFFKELSSLSDRGISEAENVIYGIKNVRGQVGQEIFNEALSQALIPPPPKIIEEPEYKNDRENQSYKRFRTALQPEGDKYIPTVFRFFVEDESVQESATKLEKERLIKLARNSGLDKIDPKLFKVKISDKQKKTGQYTITNLASYFGDLIRVGLILFPNDLHQYKQKIIDFIPYAHSDDQQAILKSVKTVTDDDLAWVNTVYLNKEDDRRYLLPRSYIYLVEEFKKSNPNLPTSSIVLKSFVFDEFISVSDKLSALDVWSKFMKPTDVNFKSGLMSLFNKIEEDEDAKQIAIRANSILIEVFKDQGSINWRFDQIKKRKRKYKRPPSGEMHNVSDFEFEISEFSFAKPLTDSLDESYLGRFIELLGFSLEILKEDENLYWEYSNYLWRIVISYLSHLKDKGHLKPLLQVEEWSRTNIKEGREHWFLSSLLELKKEYIHSLGFSDNLELISDIGRETDNV